MPKFLALTRKGNGCVISVNMSNVEIMVPLDDGGTSICFPQDGSEDVTQTIEEIVKAIEASTES